MSVFAFQRQCTAPIFGIGIESMARDYARYLNDSGASVNPFIVRRPTAEEKAGILAGEIPAFDIAAEIGRLERAATRIKAQRNLQ